MMEIYVLFKITINYFCVQLFKTLKSVKTFFINEKYLVSTPNFKIVVKI